MPLRIALLTASVPRAAAEQVRAQLAAGEIDLVVGTHALVQEAVAFRRLALVVIDEQHRFGVRQRAALARKAEKDLTPHALVMTATPIPRTLALTLYGDLDLSILDELPPGRRPVRTLLFREGQGARVTELVREAIARGEQVYVVYPLVEESEKIDLRAASESAEKLARAFPQARVDLVHGRLDADGARRRDGALRARRDAGAGLDDRDRGRGRRRERDADGDRARRALRPRAASPAARAGRPRRAPGHAARWSRAAAAPAARRGWPRCSRHTMVSRSPRPI